MDWQDEGFVLSAQRFGEGDALLEVLTRDHGRHKGLVKGGMSRARRADLQAGNRLSLEWTARLSDQLGRFTAEPVRAYASLALDSAAGLAALAAAAAVAAATLPEREGHRAVFDGFAALAEIAVSEDPAHAAIIYIKWEIGLLQDLGFALDLGSCAVTGARDDLTYVSPRTGRAVTRDAGQPYASRLLPLPAFLLGRQAGETDREALADGFRLTGHFLMQSVLAPQGHEMPKAREGYMRIVLR